ncbi:MAG: hypothetical protein Q7S21_07930 [archaeon]|nr:hypothetical protein [archaeon]
MKQKQKAFIFSIDSLLAIALVILVSYMFLLQPIAKNPATQLNILNKTILHDYAIIGFYTDHNATGLIEADSRTEGTTIVNDAKNLNLVQTTEIADDNKFVYCAFYYDYDINSGGIWLTDGGKGKVEKKEICNGVS